MPRVAGATMLVDTGMANSTRGSTVSRALLHAQSACGRLAFTREIPADARYRTRCASVELLAPEGARPTIVG